MRLYKISLNGGSRPKSDIQIFALHVAFVLIQNIPPLVPYICITTQGDRVQPFQ